MTLHMNLAQNSYDIIIEHGALRQSDKYLSLDRKILIVTDNGVPNEYAQTVAGFCKTPYIVTVPQGEGSKSFACLEKLLGVMLQNGFSRTDAVVAVGGGVVGDLAGFAASAFMRGIDFYNIPTTLLSMVDSSIGGKTAINYMGIKNCIGAFHQPKKVLIDPDVLQTLPKRQLANGLAEAIKMAATFDAELFSYIEESNIEENLDTIIIRSLAIKKNVVEQDEKESGLRRVLNFGHTIGHGIESCAMGNLYHGECVALGMLPMCPPAVKERILKVLKKSGLPTGIDFNPETVFKAVTHDKKRDGDCLRIVYVPEIGTYEVKTVGIMEFKNTIEEAFAK
ncbi:MAG: 3-dehydroquinate synthase [Ruminococcaceae bacterium]|nr:3-dehydroquinate synthase [Oscillospiraceae bacterium]